MTPIDMASRREFIKAAVGTVALGLLPYLAWSKDETERKPNIVYLQDGGADA
jgi:hypothetical protein